MRRALASLAAALTLTAVGFGASGSPAQATHALAAVPSSGVYLVVLRQAPVASYHGGTDGYAATAPKPGERFDDGQLSVAAYRDYLLAEQARIRHRIGSPDTLYSYTTALNGFAARLTPVQVKALQVLPRVLLVQPDTVEHVDSANVHRVPTSTAALSTSAAGTLHVAAPEALWKRVGGSDDAGRGAVVGVIDTGAWPENPSLAGIPISDRDLARSYPGFTGECQTGERWGVTTCGSKIIAARYFVRGFGRDNVASSDYLSPRDGSGHGTSAAAIAAGNAGVDTRIGGQDFGHISGMAPAAGLSIYKACWSAPDPSRDGCDTADTVKAIDRAVEDGVDVLNYSIGGSTTSLADAVQLAFLNAAAANVFVATAAGNDGPRPGTVQFPSPWVSTVGANTDDVFQGGVTLGNGTTLIGAMLSNTAVGPVPLVYAGDAPGAGVSAQRAALCNAGSLDAQQVDGAIVVCDRGVTSRVSKSAAVAQAGGVGMVLLNTGPASVDADLHAVPTVHLNAGEGGTVMAYVAQAGTDAVATIDPAATDNPPVPVVAGFSGRGPSSVADGDLLKPDVTAPGVSVISAVAPVAGASQFWDVESGTSTATPHVAGLAAVVKAAHPTWRPAAIKSAIMTSAVPLEGDNSPLARGAGELSAASVVNPGLVYDNGVQSWVGLLRNQGIDLDGYPGASVRLDASSLNVASIAVGDLVGRTTVTRTVTNVGESRQTYRATISGLPGVGNTITPDTLSLAAGESGRFTITLNATRNAMYDAFTAGALTWRSTTGTTVTSPIVVRPQLAKVPADVSGSGRNGTVTLTGVAGVTGTIAASTSGLVASTPVPLTLHQGSFDFRTPTSSTSTAIETLSVPAGSQVARFEVSPAGTSDDLDLYVYRGSTLVASATGASGHETVTLSAPKAGNYQVYVNAARVRGGANALADATFTSWVVPKASQGNLDLAPQSVVVGGDRFTIGAHWTGLSTQQRWFGVVRYAGLPDVTFVTVN